MGEWQGEPGVVLLPDGRSVRAVRVRRDREGVPDPELAVHLSGVRPPSTPWPRLWIRWPDFSLPLSTEDAITTLRTAHAACADQRVEVGCRGGIGRTGTAVAVLAQLAGLPAEESVVWARRHHHPRAVETPWQRRWVEKVVPRALADEG